MATANNKQFIMTESQRDQLIDNCNWTVEQTAKITAEMANICAQLTSEIRTLRDQNRDLIKVIAYMKTK